MALPLFASILLGTVASKVVPSFATKKLGMDPKAAALLGMAAGFGAGAFGAGAFSGGTGSLASMATPTASAGLGSTAGGFSGAVGGGGMGAASITSPMTSIGTPSWAPYAFRSAAAPRNVMGTSDPKVMAGLMDKGYNIQGASTLDKLRAYASTSDSQRFLGNAASTLIEGMMQEKPKPRITGGSSGGGGGGGRMAPAYPGGGGGQQTQVVWGFGQGGGFNPQPIT